MGMHLYFAYGSNLNHAEMARRCPDSAPAGPAVLKGWQLTFQGVADIERQGGARTHGALWKVSQRDLEQLDRYEGYPSLYGRELLPVRLGGDELSAITYVMRDRNGYLGLPSPSYLETIRQGYEEWGLPKLALEVAVARVREGLFDLGIRRFEPDGPKRLRPVHDP